MKKRVIIFASEFPPGPGGLGNHAHCLANHLHANRYSVSVISVAREEFDRNASTHFEYDVVKIDNKGFRPLKYVNLVKALHKQVQSGEQPILIASGMLMLILLGIYSIVFGKQFNAVAIGHGIDINASNPLHRKLVDYGLKQCKKIIAVSHYTAQKINSEFQHKVIVINNGFEKKENFTKAITKVNGTPSLITVGSISERKGQKNVVMALPAILKKYPDVHYHSIGISNQASLITETAKALHVENHISIHGPVDDVQLSATLAGSDIFAMLSGHTSAGDFEGFGIAILEANHLGIPAIGSRNSGIADAIQDQFSGILVDEHNPEEVSSAVQAIMNNHTQFSANARLHAARFSWSAIVKEYIEVFNEIIRNKISKN
jgi:phosphatidyl-myo-inositol dimannoside synthase